jgi:hypothetical protein
MRHVLCLLVDRFACERMSLRGHGRFAREHALHCIAAVGQVDPLTDDDLRTTVRHVKRPTAGGLVGTAPELLGSALSSASSPVLARADEKDGLPQHSQPRSALGTLGKLEPIRANVARAGKLGSVEPLGTAGTLSLALQALDSTRPLPSGCRVGPSGDGSCEALGGCRRWRSAPSTCVRASTVECLEGGVRPSRRTISAEVSADAETCQHLRKLATRAHVCYPSRPPMQAEHWPRARSALPNALTLFRPVDAYRLVRSWHSTPLQTIRQTTTWTD